MTDCLYVKDYLFYLKYIWLNLKKSIHVWIVSANTIILSTKPGLIIEPDILPQLTTNN